MKTIDGGLNWTIHEHCTFGTFLSAYFPDDSIGYAVGGDPFVGGIVYKTIDGGNTWNWLPTPTIGGPFHSVMFSDANTGYVIGWENVIRTEDGGLTWDILSLDGLYGYLSKASFPSYNTCFSLGGNNATVVKITNGGTEWKTISSYANVWFNSVYFTDNKIGYFGGIEYPSQGTFVVKTLDGGESTSHGTIPGLEFYTGITSIFFINANTGFATTDCGFISKTVDGGETWTTIRASQWELNFLFFTNENTGYAVGSEILKTVDGGNTWIKKSSFGQDLLSVFFAGPDIGYGVGLFGKILKTSDGGTTWNQLNSGIYDHLSSVYFTDQYVGYTVGSNGSIFKTIDGGINWVGQYSGTDNFLSSVFFINPEIGYVVGDSGIILKTNNGGSDWNLVYSGTSNFLRSVYFPSNDIGYAVGDGGTILKTLNGSSSIDELKQKNLINLYPNPTHGKVYFEISAINLNQSTFFVSIINVMGNELMNFTLQGSNMNIDVSSLPSGFYFVKVETDSRIELHKLIKE